MQEKFSTEDASMPDMRVSKGKLQLKNPIMTASGTYGYNLEYEDFTDLTSLGAIVTKAITLNPREGNPWQRIIETDCGMVNSIGLENVGIEQFLKEKLPILIKRKIDFSVNIAGSTLDEYITLARKCEANNIKMIELNVSCPNVQHGCLEFGVDENTLGSLVKSVRSVFSECLTIKLTPNVTSIENLGLACQEAGADAVSAINTLKGTGIKLTFENGKFKKEQVTGGYSGRGIKPAALSAVLRLSKVLSIPIIGIGGIYSLNDVFEFFAAGADAVQIGTANFTHPDIAGKIVSELYSFMGNNGFNTLDELKGALRNE